MTPETFSYSTGDTAIRERILSQPERWNLLMAHVVLPPGDAVPTHPTDADSFFVVVRGTLTLKAGEGPEVAYPRGTVLHLPKGTLMAPRNAGTDTVEFFVVKTPHPEHA